MRARFALALSIAVAAMCIPALAQAAPGDGDARRKEAQTLFEQGVRQAKDGDQKNALVSFRAAYDKYPSFRVLYNIGQLCERMGDAACAVRTYEQYLRDGGADVPAKRRESVEAEIKTLAKTLGTVTIRSNVTGADVTIDDVAAGKTPIADPVTINVGSHKITLVYRDKTAVENVNVKAGDAANVEVDLKDDAPPPQAPPPPAIATPVKPPPPAPAVSESPAPERHLPIVPWAVTGTLAIATVVTGVLAANSYATYKNKRNSFPVTQGDLDSAQGSARDLFVVTTVLGGATIVSAAVAGYLTLSVPSAAAANGARVRVAVGPRGVSFSGMFP